MFAPHHKVLLPTYTLTRHQEIRRNASRQTTLSEFGVPSLYGPRLRVKGAEGLSDSFIDECCLNGVVEKDNDALS